MKKSQRVIFFALLMAVGIVLSWGWVVLQTPVVSQKSGVIYYLKPGTSRKALIADLSQQGLLPHPFWLRLYSLSRYTPLKVGEYFFPQGSTPLSIWKQVVNGTGFFYRSFTIIPGWSFYQLRRALSEAEGLRHVTEALNDQQIMANLGAPLLFPEGEFLPETYRYTRGVADEVILKKAFALMQAKLTAAWQSRALMLPYQNAYEGLIMASLIEKEAYMSAERPIIAGVFVNRLRKNMLLQCDSTVVYGLGHRYDGKIHKENLLENTAYNTYVHNGLPPTPIAMPSEFSIEAAFHPEENDYLYFVARGNGQHQFSKTLIEHNKAVAAFVKQQGNPSHDTGKIH